MRARPSSNALTPETTSSSRAAIHGALTARQGLQRHGRGLALRIVRHEEGQALVEYALIIALLVVVLIAALTVLTGTLTAALSCIGAALGV